jgi:hypothetical protein
VSAVGLALLCLWSAWWVVNVRCDRLVGSEYTWLHALPSLSGDFTVSIDHVARVRHAGADPYRADWVCKRFPYPPFVIWLFAWVNLLTPGQSRVVWTALLALLLAAAGASAWLARRRAGLSAVPWSVVVAAFLCTGPVIFTMERGQCDALAIPLLFAGSCLLAAPGRGPRPRAELLAGVCFGMAAWIKFYPGIAVLALVALGRWRAVAGFATSGLVIGMIDPQGVLAALANAHHAAPAVELKYPFQMIPGSHSLSAYWRPFWTGTPSPLRALTFIPGTAAALALVLPFVLFVSRRVGRAARGADLAYPLALWLVAAGTFLPSAAADYNLIFLPLAMLAVWDRRDPLFIHILMGLALLGLQPLATPLSGRSIFAFKLAGLLATGLALMRRAFEDSSRPESSARHATRAIHAEMVTRPAQVVEW